MGVGDIFSISEEKFVELEEICEEIPGAKNPQMLIALSMYSTNSVGGGICAVFILATLGFIWAFLLSLIIDMAAFQ